MKTRNDFVSNSSSSSFICASGDIDKMAVYGDVDYYGVRRYVEKYWTRDVFSYCGSPAGARVAFEPDEKYAEGFGSVSGGLLPESARAAYGEYEAAYVAAKNSPASLRYEERAEMWKEVRRLEGAVADAIWRALEPKWKGVTLAEIDASDENGDEESMYGEFESLRDPVFYRTFNNH